MHWILGLAGRDVERIPVRVEFSGAPAFDSVLERPLTNYSAPRPGLSIPIPGDIILGILASGTPIDARVTGPNIEVAARFEPSVHARAAASPDGRGVSRQTAHPCPGAMMRWVRHAAARPVVVAGAWHGVEAGSRGAFIAAVASLVWPEAARLVAWRRRQRAERARRLPVGPHPRRGRIARIADS